ncbi:hypothetical protein HAX54_012244, partial [Datura stramonium]|nr:hypothetical protein [Datura stramonium]
VSTAPILSPYPHPHPRVEEQSKKVLAKQTPKLQRKSVQSSLVNKWQSQPAICGFCWIRIGAGILIMTRKLKKAVKADFGAFVERLQLLPPSAPPPKAPHPLTGLSFAISDVFLISSES